MKKILTTTLFFILFHLSANHVGFLHPSGGQRGKTVNIIVGGQRMWNLQGALISGGGITVESIRSIPGVPTIGGKQRTFVLNWLRNIQKGSKTIPKKPEDTSTWIKSAWFDKLDKISELERAIFIDEVFKVRNSLQMSPAINQRAIITLKIAPDAAPGRRELRIFNRSGDISNPVPFFVGDNPEVVEPLLPLPGSQKVIPNLQLPCTVNGQIMPGEMDRWHFTAKKGEKFKFIVRGRELVPFMGDCVPGHFQPIIEIFHRGKTVAFADDWGRDPDPRLNFTVPADGEYIMEIRDALHRGRADFTYRVEIGRGEFKFKISDKVPFPFELPKGGRESLGKQLTLPKMIKGVLDTEAKIDRYKIKLRPGEAVALEVFAARMDSPLDSRLVLRDADGRIVAENDDAPRVLGGKILHQADSLILWKADKAGIYTLEISDAAKKGSPDHQYYLRLDKPRPRFKVYGSPSSLKIGASGMTPLFLLVERLDGFNGKIELAAPNENITWSGISVIPPDVQYAPVTLSAYRVLKKSRLPHKLELQAQSGDFSTKIIPADEQMQAFAYNHYLIAESFMATVGYVSNYAKTLKFENNKQHLLVQPGKSAVLRINHSGGLPPSAAFEFELANPPAGLLLNTPVKRSGNVFELSISAKPEMKPQTFLQLLRVTLRYEYKHRDGKMRKTALKFYMPVFQVEILGQEE